MLRFDSNLKRTFTSKHILWYMGTVLQAFSKKCPIYLLIHLKNLIIHSFRQQHLCDLKVVKRLKQD